VKGVTINAKKGVELAHEIPRSHFHPVEAGIRANEYQNLSFPNRNLFSGT
jgi:hypothetical protein